MMMMMITTMIESIERGALYAMFMPFLAVSAVLKGQTLDHTLTADQTYCKAL